MQVNVFGIFDELQRASHQRMSKVLHATLVCDGPLFSLQAALLITKHGMCDFVCRRWWAGNIPRHDALHGNLRGHRRYGQPRVRLADPGKPAPRLPRGHDARVSTPRRLWDGAGRQTHSGAGWGRSGLVSGMFLAMASTLVMAFPLVRPSPSRLRYVSEQAPPFPTLETPARHTIPAGVLSWPSSHGLE